MSSLPEIQDAVAKLPADERKALLNWLASANEPEINAEEEEKLLSSLDEAIRNIDAGKGVPIDEVRKRVSAWVAR